MAENLEKVENNLEIITQKFDNITKDRMDNIFFSS